MSRYVEELNGLLDELQASEFVEVRDAWLELTDFPQVVVGMKVDQIADATGIELSDDLVDCINASNGPRAWWSYEIDDQRRGSGEFHLLHLKSVFTSEPPQLWSEETPAEEVELLEKLHVIDQRPHSGDDKFAAFKIDRGKMPPEIWYYDRGDCALMDITYGGYVEALLDMKGVPDWQYLFCDVDLQDPQRAGLGDKLGQRLRDLETLFPHREYSTYYQRLEAMGE